MIATRRRGYGTLNKKEPYLVNPTGNRGVLTTDFAPSSWDDVEIKFFTTRRLGYIINSNNFYCNFVNNSLTNIRFFNQTFSSPKDIELNTPIVIKKTVQQNGDYTIFVDGQVAYSGTTTKYNCGKLIFYGYDAITYDWLFFGGIAYIKVSSGSELRFCGIPREVDGVCGMYDTVSGIFHTRPAMSNFNTEFIIETL